MYKVEEFIAYGGIASVYASISPKGTLKKQHITKHVANPMLRHEACAMEILKGSPFVPSVDAWARSQYYERLSYYSAPWPYHRRLHRRRQVPRYRKYCPPCRPNISHMHSRHIIHCDIKPGNFLFGVDEHSKPVYLTASASRPTTAIPNL
ncbi:hypothetical protein B0H10DRAFT_1315626 [Mycena sp. CBHHK59/15]|nr:hypothetical protein B0H10DRAFT_1315626 [Mycena sp. CBHHK59/15]